jgi:hypothetical protein
VHTIYAKKLGFMRVGGVLQGRLVICLASAVTETADSGLLAAEVCVGYLPNLSVRKRWLLANFGMSKRLSASCLSRTKSFQLLWKAQQQQ